MAVKKVMESLRQRFLIADDVGLGKTIEAGLIMQELTARQRGTRPGHCAGVPEYEGAGAGRRNSNRFYDQLMKVEHDDAPHHLRMLEREPQRDLAAIADSDQIRLLDSLLNKKGKRILGHACIGHFGVRRPGEDPAVQPIQPSRLAHTNQPCPVPLALAIEIISSDSRSQEESLMLLVPSVLLALVLILNGAAAVLRRNKLRESRRRQARSLSLALAASGSYRQYVSQSESAGVAQGHL